MTTLVHELANRVASIGALIAVPPGGLGFTVLERWPTPEGPGATPEAFDPAHHNRLKRLIVVLDGGEVAWSGPQPGIDFRRWDSFPLTYIFAEAHANGKQAALDAYLLIEGALHLWEAVVSGQRIGFRTDNRLALQDDAAWPHNTVIVGRWRATGVRQLVAI